MANATIPYIIAEDGFYYVAYKEKVKVPELVVSSKGVANGLSEEYNDGWDFGPDSYSPASTSAIPYTQTCGIMEGYNYLPVATLYLYDSSSNLYTSTGKIGTIKLLGTLFNITEPVIFNTNDQINFIAEGGTDIVIPVNGNISQKYDKTIISSNSNKGCFVIQPSPNLPSDIVGIGIINIDGINFQQTVQITNPVISGEPYVVAIGSTSSAYNRLTIGAISVNDYTYQNGLLGIFTNDLEGGTFISILNGGGGTNTNAPLFNFTLNHLYIGQAQNPGSGNSVSVPNGNSYIFYFDITQDCYIGSLHLYASNYNGLIYSVQPNPIFIGYINFEVSSPTNPASPVIHINGTVNVGALSVNGGYMPYPSDFDNPEYFIIQTYNRTGYGAGAVPLFKNDFTVTLPANPPVSGTVYQNTNPYDIEIDLPVYATTSATAGYVTVAKGTTDTPTAIGNQYVSGDTSDTSEQIIRLRVPAGWYYEFTASGVTFGTASVFAD